jgi:hypothetical protein
MKQLILIALLSISLFACKKTTTPPSTPSNPSPNPQVVYHSLPNWISDTLVAQVIGVGAVDTMYAYTVAGKSYIKHKGIQYEIKAYELKGQKWSDSAQEYFCDIFDPSGKQINPDSTLNTVVNTSQYWDESFKVIKKSTQFIVAHYPPFHADATGYMGQNKK